MNRYRLNVLAFIVLLWAAIPSSFGAQFDTNVPLYQKGTSTYYVNGQINGHLDSEFMVDTGSGYVTINPQTLKNLKRQGKVRYVKELLAVLADGNERTVPVYQLSSLQIGDGCTFYNIEAAVIPGSTRNILGMSALKKAAPFAISVEPATLMLTNCTLRDAASNTVATEIKG